MYKLCIKTRNFRYKLNHFLYYIFYEWLKAIGVNLRTLNVIPSNGGTIMISLLHLHIVSLLLIGINYFILNRSLANNLASKYFLINYIFHNHSYIRFFIVYYPFLIIAIYLIFGNVIPIGSAFVAVLHVYFMHELISGKNIEDKEEYINWYTHNVEHAFSMHSHDILRKNFHFLYEKVNRLILFKFELIFFAILIIESEVFLEVVAVLDSLK